jgi:predicted nucleotidyltransferase
MRKSYRTRNRHATFLKAGRIISARIAKLDGVVGILGTGSIGRKFGDQYSDLDLIVYAHAKAVRKLDRLLCCRCTGWKGMEFDIPVVSYERALREKVPSSYWSQVIRWDRQNSEILYDTQQRIEKLLGEKLVYPDSEQQKLLNRYRHRTHECLVFYPELWAERGQLHNVVDSLFRAVQNIVLWIYAKNRVFEPYVAKWLFYHLEVKAVPEHVHLKTLTEVYTTPTRDLKTATQIRQRLLDVCNIIGLKWDVYGYAEAHERSSKNWEKLPQATKDILGW